MSSSFHVVIPSRYKAQRLPGKPLLCIGKKTLIQHVYDAASKSQAEKITIGTDDQRIAELARSFGAEVMMTSSEHQSGTDRIAEVIRRQKLDDDVIIVNVQGDEFALPPVLIDQVAMALITHPQKHMATLCEKIHDSSEINNPAVVKVVRDKDNNALYFSRTLIPWQSSDPLNTSPSLTAFRHIGLYAYRAGFLKQFADLHACDLEKVEKLEQLRALYNGYIIHVEEANAPAGIGIDTELDLEQSRKLYEKGEANDSEK